MIAILFSFLFFRFGLAQWPFCPPPPGDSMICLGGDCNMVNAVTIDSVSYFDDWDMALSSVVEGPAVISIDSSIVIPNRWTLMPQDFCYSVYKYVPGVNNALGVDIDKPWNVYDNGSTYKIPLGQYGILVINPWTTTFTGTASSVVDPACGRENCAWQAPFILNNWQAHIRRLDPSLGPGLFVGGTINLLLSDTTPIPCRLGDCSHS